MAAFWTDDKVERLKRLHADGLSASQIAEQLGGGTTRNAVIGQIHRKKLGGAPMPKRTAVNVASIANKRLSRLNDPALPAPKAPRRWTPAKPVAAEPIRVPYLDRDVANQCAWPLWEAGESAEHRTCCGLPIDRQRRYSISQPYCEGHQSVSQQGRKG